MAGWNLRELGAYIREQRDAAEISIRQLARLAGVSNPYLSQIERGMRKPSADILQQIARALRISAEALYVQAGILDERWADSDVPGAVLADPHITERQKQVLVEIYESFRRENDAAGVAPGAAASPADAYETDGYEAGEDEAGAAEPAATQPAAQTKKNTRPARSKATGSGAAKRAKAGTGADAARG
jgi:transcriptional regulator with XRE-family HTH domain